MERRAIRVSRTQQSVPDFASLIRATTLDLWSSFKFSGGSYRALRTGQASRSRSGWTRSRERKFLSALEARVGPLNASAEQNDFVLFRVQAFGFHARRIGRHSRHRESHGLRRLFGQEAQHGGRWNMPFENVTSAFSGVAGPELVRNAQAPLHAVDFRRVDCLDWKPALAQVLNPSAATAAVGVFGHGDLWQIRTQKARRYRDGDRKG